MSVLPFFLIILPLAYADSNGMDMSMDGAMSLSMGRGSMLNFLHFSPGDTLWFLGWSPSTGGAMVGACIALFLLGIVERLLAGIRGVGEAQWRKMALIEHANRLNSTSCDECPQEVPFQQSQSLKSSIKSTTSVSKASPPLILAHDIPRGVLHAIQSIIGFAFMLVIMTFQVGFMLSIVVGLGVGEILFGRYANAAAHLA